MYRTLFSMLTFVLLASCGQELPVDVSSKENSYIITPFVIKESGKSEYVVADYLPVVSDIDSITASLNGIAIEPAKTRGIYKIGLDKAQGRLSTITIWFDSKSADQIVVDKREEHSQRPLIIYTKQHGKKELVLGFSEKPEEVVAMWQNIRLPEKYLKIHSNHITVKLPFEAESFAHSSLRVFAASREGVYNDVLVPLTNGRVADKVTQLAKNDPHKRVLYSLMIDRFYDGNPSNTRKLNRPDVLPIVDYMGGDFVGITKIIKDGYFTDLGINAIWISPITKNPEDAWGLNENPRTRFSGYHGYWPIYTTVIDDRFGTEAELRELLQTAHDNNIDVILDYVANHLHIDSPLLQANPDWKTELDLPDGRKNLELWDEYRLTTWFDLHIPSMDLGRPDVYEPLTDSAMYWLENFEFDGFRHDATKHIPEVFWRTLTQKIHQRIKDRDIYQIGETYGSPDLIDSYVRSGMLDGQFDFNVYFAARDNLTTEEGDMNELSRTIRESLSTYGYHNLMGYITGNHDQGRFISMAGGALAVNEDQKAAGWTREVGVGDSIGYDRMELYQALLFSIPGVPCIYQGDEYGEPGGNDPDNRKMMRFDGYSEKEQSLHDAVAKLAHQRTSSMPLLYGTYVPLYSDKDVLLFARVYMGDVIVAGFNRSGEPHTIKYDLSLIGGRKNSAEEVNIPAYGYKFVEYKLF